MYNSSIDNSFLTEHAAREYAAQASGISRGRLYIILAGDEYFVSATKNVQSYEKLVASYVCGNPA